MKENLVYLIILIPITFVLGGIYLAMNGIEGWGWLIFGGLVTSSGISIKTRTSKKKRDKIID